MDTTCGPGSVAPPNAWAVTTYCQYYNGTPVGSCIYYQNGSVNAEGVNNAGRGYCLWKAHEEETYPGGYFNTPDYRNWCGNPKKILMGTWAGHGGHCAILWGNSNNGQGWWQVAKVCHNY